MSCRSIVIGSWLGVIVLSFGVGGWAHAADSQKKTKDKPYPLGVCIVSDEKLGAMGDPHVISYKGREIKFCCSGCEDDFRKDPEKYLTKLDKAAKSAATKPATKPADKSDKQSDAQG